MWRIHGRDTQLGVPWVLVNRPKNCIDFQIVTYARFLQIKIEIVNSSLQLDFDR